MSQTEQESSRKQREAFEPGSDAEAWRVQRFGVVVYIAVAILAGGVLDPERVIKLTWGVIVGAIAAVLAGGLDARCRTGRPWPRRRSRY